MSARGVSILGLALAGLLILLWAFGAFSASQRHSSQGPLGYAGLIGMLEERGMTIEVSDRPPSREERDQYARLLIEPLVQRDGISNAGRLSERTLSRKIDNLPTIVIFPKWVQRGAQVGVIPVEEGAALVDHLIGSPRNKPDFDRRKSLEKSKIVSKENPDSSVIYRQGIILGFERIDILAREGQYIMAGEVRKWNVPDLLLFFDPDVLSNHGLANGKHATWVIPEIERFVGERTLLVDLSNWEPSKEPRETRSLGAGERKPPETHRLFQPPFLYVWLAFAILVGLGLWAFLGRAERRHVDPNTLAPPPSIDRRLARFARLWARHVQPATIHDLYETALLTQTFQRLGVRAAGDARLAALIALEDTRHGTTRLKDWSMQSSMPLKRLQDLRRILHDL